MEHRIHAVKILHIENRVHAINIVHIEHIIHIGETVHIEYIGQRRQDSLRQTYKKRVEKCLRRE